MTLERPDLARRLTVVRQPRKLPLVLSAEEVARLIEAAPGPKYKAAFATAYGAGLRVAEVVALRVGDVDSTHMMLRIEQGNIARARELIAAPEPSIGPPAEHDGTDVTAGAAAGHRPPCPCCGGRMIVVETFERGGAPRAPASPEPGVRTATP